MLFSIFGIIAILAIAFLLSSGKKRIKLRVVGAAFGLQALMALLVLRTDFGVRVIQFLSDGVIALLGYSVSGIETLFGPMGDNPFANTFLIAALPVIVFFAALVSILYYLGIMQQLVRWLGGAIGWLTGISKVEALGSAANIFVGQSESPLVVRPYLAALPPSRLFTLMCVGMAGVAGTILAAYASFLGSDAVPYLLAAAFMSAPGGILMAKIIMPDDEYIPPGKHERLQMERSEHANVILAAAAGTTEGLRLAVNIGAMLVAFVALIALLNGFLGWVAGMVGVQSLTLEQIFGTLFAPLMYLISIPWEEAQAAGALFGEKIIERV